MILSMVLDLISSIRQLFGGSYFVEERRVLCSQLVWCYDWPAKIGRLFQVPIA